MKKSFFTLTAFSLLALCFAPRVRAEPRMNCSMVPNGSWRSFELPQFPGWTLRARCNRFQTAMLSLELLDDTGCLARKRVQLGFITGGRGIECRQLDKASHHLDPFELTIHEFRPGRQLKFSLPLDRLAYCAPAVPLYEFLSGYDRAGPNNRLAAGSRSPVSQAGPETAEDLPSREESYIDPVLAIEGCPDMGVLSWADGRFEIRRFYTLLNGKISASGYIALDRRSKTWQLLFHAASDDNSSANGRLLGHILLSLSLDADDEPLRYILDRDGWRPFPSIRR